MEKCIKCGATLPAGAKVCPSCGNPVSWYEAKKQDGSRFSSVISPRAAVPSKQAKERNILILAVVALSGLLVLSLAFALMLWTAPKLVVSSSSLDYGRLQVGSQGSQTLTLSNSGRQDITWTAVKGKADWLTLDPGQGRIPSGGSQTIHVLADTTLLAAGHYSASISFTSNGGDMSVSVVLTVVSRPVVSSIEPKAGPATGGTIVTIQGVSFTGASHVLFGGTAASTFVVNSDTQITVASPAGSGRVHIIVITPLDTTSASTADQFTYLPAPTVASISPQAGPVTGGTRVTIRGSGFTGASKVLFGTIASTFTVNSDTQITTVSPAGSGTVHVTVITPGGTTATSTADQFTYQAAPKITRIQPTRGLTTGGVNVIIRGTGFTRASQVLFGSTASTFTVSSDTQIIAVSPAGRGTVHITVTTPGGTTATSTADQFTYLAIPPKITSIAPTAGPTAGRTTVTIQGSGFTGASQVLFGSRATSSFTVNSDTQITAVSPAGRGTVHITVTAPGGTSGASAHDQFTYLAAPPTIASISPTSGPAEGGTRVTIRGSGFTGASQVLFGSTSRSFTVNSDTQITVVSPAGSGTVHITVITPLGTTAASAHDQFTYLTAPPKIASISPTSGPRAGGTTVTIRGSGFTGASQVLFGSTSRSFTVNSDTQITVVSPAGRGTVHITVITPVGSTAASAHDQFQYR